MSRRGNSRKKKKKLKSTKELPPVRTTRNVEDFKFDISEIFQYDVPQMKAPSNLDVIRNKRVLRANIPTKLKKTRKKKTKKRVLGELKEKKKMRLKDEDGIKLSSISERLPYLKDVFLGDKEPSKQLLEESNNLFYRKLESRKIEKKKKRRIAPDDEEEIKKLTTGEDAVAFFSRAGKNTAVKFVYLNRKGAFKGETIKDVKRREYDPYSLVVVDREKVNPEYFTMSASGVVHIQPNQPTEYMSLSEWMKESTMFKILRRIHFFKYYLAFKSFKLWHKNTRHQHFCKKRAKLANEFFLVQKTFSSTLLDIHKHCYKLQDIKLMNFSNKLAKNGAFEKSAFVSQQQKIRLEAADKFNGVLIEGFLQQLCKTVTSRAKLEKLETPEAIRAYLSGRNIPQNTKQISIKKSKSMYESQQEDEDRKKAMIKAKKEKLRLGNFIRLCDYMSIEYLISSCKNTLIKLFKEMQEQQDKSSKRIMFNVYIDFDEMGNLIYTPEKNDMFDMFDFNSQKMIEAVGKVTRLLDLRSLKIFFLSAGIQKSKWRIGEAIENDNVFIEFQNKIKSLVQDSFHDAVVFGSKFSSMKDEYLYVKDWDDEKYQKQHHTHELFNVELQRVKKTLYYLKKRMQTNKDCKILKVDSKKLKNFLEPKMENILATIKRTINYTSKKMCFSSLENLKKIVKDLDKKPSTLHDFAVFVDTLNKVKNMSIKIRKDIDEITKIFELALSNKEKTKTEEIKVEGFESYEGLPLDDIQDELMSCLSKFESKQSNAELFKSKNMTKNTQELDAKISGVDSKLMRILKELQGDQFTSSASDSEDIIAELEKYGEEIREIKSETIKYNEYKVLFGDPVLEWSSLVQVENIYELRSSIWDTLNKFEEKSRDWLNTDIKRLDSQSINSYVNDILRKVSLRIKGELKEKFGKNYKDNVVEYLLTIVNRWKERERIIGHIGNKHLKDGHWKNIFNHIGTNYSSTNSYTLLQLETYGVFQHADIVKMVSEQATGEAVLQNSIDEIEGKWKITEFIVKPHRENEEVYVLGSVEDIVDQLDEHQITLQSMQANEHIMGVKSKVDIWERKLSEVTEIIEEWLTVQKKWMYLENIFESDDIKRQLHEESSKFNAVNEIYTEIMKHTHTSKNVIAITDKKLRSENNIAHLSTLQECNYILDEIQKNLEDFLLTKRDAFPRFYFLSNEELLEVLSHKKSASIHAHLSKCFDNVKSLKYLKEDPRQVCGIYSEEGEYLQFKDNVWTVGNIEFWLGRLLEEITTTLKANMSKAIKSYKETTKIDWIFEKVPSQCILTADRIIFTRGVEKAFDEIYSGDNIDSLKEFKQLFSNEIKKIVEIIRKKELSENQRTLVNSIIILSVYSLDVIENLIREGVMSETDFTWTSQIRHYWNENITETTIHQASSVFRYGYEYIGNRSRLVITPLTERCYFTCTNALKNLMGGCVQGPAGTGKTETIKDLAKMLGRQCVVFNCSEGLKIKMMNRMFCGLVQSGSWACFDEFNRIEVEVLSVVAEYMKTIQNALKLKQRNFIFEGRDVSLNNNYGVFITINPSDYGGRTELPVNLKSMFRPVSMMVPNYILISEIMLFSEGFEDSNKLAQKIIKLFKLTSEQLSKQTHYDFGLRAIKNVLKHAGLMKRSNPLLMEEMILLRAARDSSIPRFLKDDKDIFGDILNDLFPGVLIQDVNTQNLKILIENELKNNDKQPISSYISKIIQLQRMLKERNGVIILGKAACGKSTMYQTLQTTNRKTKVHVINPKSVPLDGLYGKIGTALDWHDGLIGNFCREFAKEKSFNQNWLVFDGEVDSTWVENLNTVLDDTKMLCLNNGERIKVSDNVKFIFEVEDLNNASPATVSRCGIVYIEEYDLDMVWRPVMESWLSGIEKKSHKDVFELIQKLCKHFVGPSLHHLRSDCEEFVNSINYNIVHCMFKLLDVMLFPSNVDFKERVIWKGEKQNSEKKKMKISIEKMLKQNFIFSYIWSFGSNIKEESREKFDSFSKLLINEIELFPKEGTVFDYFVDNFDQRFKSWKSIVPKFSFAPEIPFNEVVVPTPETVSLMFLMKKLCQAGVNVMLNGESGAGKTVLVDYFLKKELDVFNPDSKFQSANVNLSAKTKSDVIVEVLNSQFSGKSKKFVGDASGGKKSIVFIDNLNLPIPSTSVGSDKGQVYEFIRQTVDQGGFFDIDKLFFKKLVNANTITCCGTSFSGSLEISQRLLRHFHKVYVPNVGFDSMKDIFISVLKGFFMNFTANIKTNINAFVRSSIKVLEEVKKTFLPIPSKGHYRFNLKDLSKFYQGIMLVSSEEVNTKRNLVDLFCHESQRVFGDRLVSNDDKLKFNEILTKTVNVEFEDKKKTEEIGDILFGNYLSKGSSPYCKIKFNDSLVEELEQLLDDYNIALDKNEKIVFFKESVFYINSVCRVFSLKRGNAILLGVSGSGRKSVAKLAAYLEECQYTELQVKTQNYQRSKYLEKIKSCCLTAGLEEKRVVLLIEDNQIINDYILEDIHNILTCGDILHMYTVEEMEKIILKVGPRVRKKSKTVTKETIFRHFTKTVMENLHVVLCLNPNESKFKRTFQQFPSLISNSTLICFSEWSERALQNVARSFLVKDEFNLKSKSLYVDKSTLERLALLCVKIHKSSVDKCKVFEEEFRMKNYVTPKLFVELIDNFKEIMSSKTKKLNSALKRLDDGINTLRECNKQVEEMRRELTVKNEALKVELSEKDKLSTELENEKKRQNEEKKNLEIEEKIYQSKFQRAKVIRDECQLDLEKALPAYRKATKAVQNLKKEEIAEIKSFQQPPLLVKIVLEAVCVLFKIKKPSFEESLKLITDIGFKSKLLKYEKENISDSIMKKLKKYIERDDFDPEKIAKHNMAAKSLSMYVIALYDFATIHREIIPKEKRLKVAEQEFEVAQKKFEEMSKNVKDIEVKIHDLEEKHFHARKKISILKNDIKNAELRMERANTLLSGLAGEEKRWLEQTSKIKSDINNIVGDTMLASGCVSYFGPFNMKIRKDLISEWVEYSKSLKIKVTENFTLRSVLADEILVREWIGKKLPDDEFSIQNAIIIKYSKRWPLIIDPQEQAIKWIKNIEHNFGVKCVDISADEYLRKLENSIKIGIPTVFLGCGEKIDPSMKSLLLKQIKRKSSKSTILIGENEIDYNNNFKLYLITKLDNPNFNLNLFSTVSVINFSITPVGLEDQLLSDVVGYERPDYEQEKDVLIKKIADEKISLKEKADKILETISKKSDTNLLDDIDLIDELNISKRSYEELKENIRKSEETAKRVNVAREKYRPVVVRASLLYFSMRKLSLVDSMYQYSLSVFKNLFTKCLESSKRANSLKERLDILMHYSTKFIYDIICRGLFEKHKLLFAFLIAIEIIKKEGIVTEEEWKFFLIGFSGEKVKSKYSWLSNSQYSEIMELSKLDGFGKVLLDSLENSSDEWKVFLSSSSGNVMKKFPSDLAKNFSDWRKLVVIKSVYPALLSFGMKYFVKVYLGPKFLVTHKSDLSDIMLETNYKTPIFYILNSKNVDPISKIERVVRDKKREEKTIIISLGEGQGPKAERLIESAQLSGDWVVLQNVHLAISWLPTLERIIAKTISEQSSVDHRFRLILTSFPMKGFPVSILRNSVKITSEPKRGIKANMLNILNTLDSNRMESMSKKNRYKKLLFSLVFFHCIIQERGRYGTLGWSLPYEWSNVDFDIARKTLRESLEGQDKIPFKSVKYLINLQYGGKLVDFVDVKTMHFLSNLYILPKVVNVEKYAFSKDKVYHIPSTNPTLNDMINYVITLPDVSEDDPLLFGLHPNANISLQNKNSKMIIESILNMETYGGSNVNTLSEMSLKGGIILNKLLELCPEELNLNDINSVNTKRFENNSMNPLGIFLLQEIKSFNKLVKEVRRSLENLNKAFLGTTVMTNDLERLSQDVSFQRVPREWRNISPSKSSGKNLTQWLFNLSKQEKFLKEWMACGSPTKMDLSSLFFPQGYGTTLLQMYSRIKKISLNNLAMNFEILNDEEDKKVRKQIEAQKSKRKKEFCIESNIYLDGIYMEGAKWNSTKSCIEDSGERMLFCKMPLIKLIPMEKKFVTKKKKSYSCPLYRENDNLSKSFLFSIDLNVGNESAAHWIRRSCRLLTSI